MKTFISILLFTLIACAEIEEEIILKESLVVKYAKKSIEAIKWFREKGLWEELKQIFRKSGRNDAIVFCRKYKPSVICSFIGILLETAKKNNKDI